jgi:hypothetical protein
MPINPLEAITPDLNPIPANNPELEAVETVLGPGDELIWVNHFSDRHTANVLSQFGVRTFADMSRLSREQLETTFLDEQSIQNAIYELGKRGLQLSEVTPQAQLKAI